MKNSFRNLPPEYRLQRKEVCYCLKWSRTTLWRRECAGLRFVEGTIELGTLLAWLQEHRRGGRAEKTEQDATQDPFHPVPCWYEILLEPSPVTDMFALPKNGHR